MTLAWEAAGATEVGRVRASNEDAFRMDPARGIFLVADGMGGHVAGEVASRLAAEAFASTAAEGLDAGVPGPEIPRLLQEASVRAHTAILTCCADDPAKRGMGTTLTACVLDPAGTAYVAHIGDSRLYRMDADGLTQLTSDHTWVQREVEAGRLGAGEADKHPLSHILSRVLTDDLQPDIDLVSRPVSPGDLLLLATDGLYNVVDDRKIARILQLDLPLHGRVDALLQAADRAGAPDNVTVVLVRIVD